ncbi:MAG: hypothetical protein ACTH5C_15800 [Pseudoalteromonas prydzensis]
MKLQQDDNLGKIKGREIVCEFKFHYGERELKKSLPKESVA